MKKLALTLAVMLLPPDIGWAADNLSLQGVWEGTIGALPVVACLQTKSDYHYGAYYYKNRLQNIELEEKSEGRTWLEGDAKNKMQWKLDAVKGNDLTGTWESPAKKLPIKLARVDVKGGASEDSACASDAYFLPRLTKPKITEIPATLDGQAYTKVSVDAGKQLHVRLNTFKLNGSSAPIAAVNQELLKAVPVGAALKDSDYAQCISGGLQNSGNDGDYDVHAEPAVLTPHWLVVHAGDGSYCGGAHPVNSRTTDVYDLRQGKLVEMQKWFVDGTFDQDGQLTGKLLNLAVSADLKQRGAKDECSVAAKGATFWTVSLAKKGINLTPSLPYAEQACSDDVVMGFDALVPFMNEEGKKQLADFRSELPK